jgi:hypothetical protein
MNLRHENSSKEATLGKPWYQQPETTVEVSAEPLQAVQEPQEPAQESLFEPSAAERILARAGALQEVQGQMLSQEQIEAVAAEVGIKPEFVHLAIEQEKTSVVSRPRYAVETTKERQLFANARVAVIASMGISIACNVLANALFSDLFYSSYRPAALWWLAFGFPSLLAFSYGVLFRSRRAGAAAGALLGATTTVAVLFNYGMIGHSITMGTAELLVVVAMIAGGTLLGAAGAQARRVVSRRQASNRSRRTIIHERSL